MYLFTYAFIHSFIHSFNIPLFTYCDLLLQYFDGKFWINVGKVQR